MSASRGPDRSDQLDAYVPAPSLGASPPPLWGSDEHVRRLLGERVTDAKTGCNALLVDRFADGAAFRDYFKDNYGPTISAYRAIGGDPERTASLDADIARLGDDYLRGGPTMEWEYLLLTARKS